MTAIDAVVLGLGIHGAATTYELASRGLTAVALEQFERGHSRGSSHGATRMIRRAYPHPVWNELVDHAYRGWDRWSRRAGRPFLTTTGGVYAAPEPGALQGGRTAALSPGDASPIPGFAIPAGHHAIHDPDAGVVAAADALAWAWEQAAALGAELSFGERVLDWAATEDGVRVRTDRREIEARHLVVAGGAWLPSLLPRYAPHVEVWRILTLSAAPGQDAAQAPRLGAFSVARDEGLVFGLPEAAGAGAKIGVDAGELWDPDVPVAPPTPDEVAALRAHFAAYAPGVDLDGAVAEACLYTMTPDKRFVVGTMPEHPGVVVAAACSGHGFKFGPAIGEAAADLVDGIERPDLAFLSPEREAIS